MTDLTPALAMQAYLLGKRIAGQRRRQPVAYLYNGVRLPGLPEGMQAQPNTVIFAETFFHVPSTVRFYAYSTSLPFAYNGTHLFTDGATEYCYSRIDLSDSPAWEDAAGAWSTVECNESEDGVDSTVMVKESVVWSNHDIINADDGTLFLAASDPVPVYE